MADVEREIERFEPASMRDQIRKSWDDEATVETVAQARELMAAQLPFHFWEMGDAYRTFTERDDTVYSPEVLRHFAANGYGDFEWVDHLRWISKPMLILTGRLRADVLGRPGRGDPPRGRRLAAGGDREGRAHDVRRAAQGVPDGDPRVVHRAGRDRRAGGRGRPGHEQHLARVNVLVVHAHPEPRSFCSALKDAAVEELGARGHEVTLSDLYAERFRPDLSADDFLGRENGDVLRPMEEQKHASSRARWRPTSPARSSGCGRPTSSCSRRRCGGSRCRRCSRAGSTGCLSTATPTAPSRRGPGR